MSCALDRGSSRTILPSERRRTQSAIAAARASSGKSHCSDSEQIYATTSDASKDNDETGLRGHRGPAYWRTATPAGHFAKSPPRARAWWRVAHTGCQLLPTVSRLGSDRLLRLDEGGSRIQDLVHVHGYALTGLGAPARGTYRGNVRVPGFAKVAAHAHLPMLARRVQALVSPCLYRSCPNSWCQGRIVGRPSPSRGRCHGSIYSRDDERGDRGRRR